MIETLHRLASRLRRRNRGFRSAGYWQNRYSAPHIRNWTFTDWIAANAPEWQLVRKIENKYPFDATNPGNTSFSDFYIFEKRSSGEAA